MKYLAAVVQETLRIDPPLEMGFKEVIVPCKVYIHILFLLFDCLDILQSWEKGRRVSIGQRGHGSCALSIASQFSI